MLKTSLRDFRDAYILAKGTITVAIPSSLQADKNNKQAIFKTYAQFTDCVTGMNKTHVDNSKDI